MNAHQTYLTNVLKDVKPEEIAALLVNPPAGNSKNKMGVAEIHAMVVAPWSTPALKGQWASMLARAAGTERAEGWPANWSLPLLELLDQVEDTAASTEAPAGADVVEMGRQAA